MLESSRPRCRKKPIIAHITGTPDRHVSAERNRFRVCKHSEEAQEENSRVNAKSDLQALQGQEQLPLRSQLFITYLQ